MANSASSNELHSITKHNNIVISGVGANEVLKFDGSNWINQTLAESGIAPVASPTFTTGATSPAWITGNDGTVKFNDNDGSHYFTLAANATTTTSVAYTWPVNAGTDNYVLTTNGSGVLTWEEVVGGTSVAGTTDNGILTFVNSGSTFAAESTLTYTGTVLTVNAGGGTPQIQAITTATSGRAVAFQAKIAASSTDNSAGLDFIEGSGNGNAGNMAYHLIYEGKSSGSNLRLNSEDIDGSSTGGTIFQVMDGGNDVTFTGGVISSTSISAQNSTNAGINHVGKQTTVSMSDNQTMSIVVEDSAFVMVRNGTNGRAGLFFAEYGSNMIEISDPGNIFEPSETDNGKINVYKGTNAGTMYVMNRSNATVNISVLVLGKVVSASAPS